MFSTNKKRKAILNLLSDLYCIGKACNIKDVEWLTSKRVTLQRTFLLTAYHGVQTFEKNKGILLAY